MAMTIELGPKVSLGSVTRYQFSVGLDKGSNEQEAKIYKAGLAIERALPEPDSGKKEEPSR